jgi:ribonuclease HIII
MSKVVLLIFIFTSSIIFSQNKIDVNILDSYKNEIDLSNFQKEKQLNIHSIKKLKKNRVFEFSNFFCNQGRQLINFNVLPNRISIKYFILENKNNKQNKIKTYLHCFIYSKEKSFFEKCKEVSLSTDCFSFIKAKSKFYYIGNIIGFQNSIVFLEKIKSE